MFVLHFGFGQTSVRQKSTTCWWACNQVDRFIHAHWFVLQGTPASTNQKSPWIKGDDRTLEGNAEEAQVFAETAQNRATLQYFFNCEFQPVIRVERFIKVLDILTIPVLQCTQFF